MLQRIVSRLGHDTVEPGADTERTMGFGNTIMVWLAANMVVTTLLTGTLFVPGIPYLQAVLIILLGTLLGVGALALVGCIGTRTGLPTMVLTRASFGIRGGTFPALLGHRGIEKVEPFIAVVMIGLALFVFYSAFSRFGVGEFAAIPADPSTVITEALAF